MARHGDERKFRKLASRFRVWLKTEGKPGIINELLKLSDAEVAGLADAYPDLIASTTVRIVLDRSEAMVGCAPPAALSSARLATLLAERAMLAIDDDDILVADAWRQYAKALAGSGEYYDANEACDRAESLYLAVTSRDTVFERAVLALSRGQALFYLNRGEEALAVIEAAAIALRPLNKRKYLIARTTYAVALLGLERFEAAAVIFEEAAGLASEVGDSEALANIVGNMGECYARLGLLAEAREYLQSAIKEYQRLGLKAYVLRRRTTLVRVLIQESKFNEAISQLFDIRRCFLDLEMPVLAANTGLWLVDVLYLAGRVSQVPSLCEELIEVFRDKKLPREATKALAYLNDSLAHGVRRSDIAVMRDFMIRLEANAKAVFIPPTIDSDVS